MNVENLAGLPIAVQTKRRRRGNLRRLGQMLVSMTVLVLIYAMLVVGTGLQNTGAIEAVVETSLPLLVKGVLRGDDAPIHVGEGTNIQDREQQASDAGEGALQAPLLLDMDPPHHVKYRRLVQQEGVSAMLASISSGNCNQVAPVAEGVVRF